MEHGCQRARHGIGLCEIVARLKAEIEEKDKLLHSLAVKLAICSEELGRYAERTDKNRSQVVKSGE